MRTARISLSCFVMLLMGVFQLQGDATTLGIFKDKTKTSSFPVHLVLQTSEKSWRIGKPTTITVYLHNTSRQTYYVGSVFGLGVLAPFHYVELKITDENNKEIGHPTVSITAADSSNKVITEKIAQAYTRLGPNMIHGVSISIDIGLRPGRYKLTAIYHEVEAIYWKENERKSLPFPVLTERLVSNTVSVYISP